jgi:hypothetical protein
LAQIVITEDETGIAVYDFTIEQGATLSLPVSKQLDDGTPIDYTGYTANLTGNYSKQSGEFAFKLTTEDGGIIVNGPQIMLIFSPETTNSLLIKPIKYDLELYGPDGYVDRVIEGTITLDPRCKR